MSELRPCPFCGGDDVELLGNHVQCFGCGAQGPRFTEGQSLRAISAWDKRNRETCRVESTTFDDDYLQYVFELSCGDVAYHDEMRGPRYCPECGRLVVRGTR